jgi:hypothetical protein
MSIVQFWNKHSAIIIFLVCLSILISIRFIFKTNISTPKDYEIKVNVKKKDIKKIKKKRFNKNEEECRRIFEKVIGKRFPRIRPDFLKNPITGKNLELDGYNEELKLAFEYQGEQHYKKNYFHKSELDYKLQVEKDELKRRLLAQEGIALIEIPYTVKFNDLDSFIREKLKK